MYHVFYAVPSQLSPSHSKTRQCRYARYDKAIRWADTGAKLLIRGLAMLCRLALLMPTLVLAPVAAAMWCCACHERRAASAVTAQKRAWILEMEAMDRF